MAALNRRVLSAIILIAGISVWRPSSVEGESSAQELLQRVVATELKAQADDHSHWEYQSTSRASGKNELKEVIQSKQGEVDAVLSIDRQPLTPAQQRAEIGRIQHLVHDPHEQRKRLRDQQHDSQETEHLFKVLPQAVTARYGKPDGDLTELDFQPNPSFRPSSHEEKVFHAMAGKIWIDTKKQRLARIEGHLTHSVKFGGGLLGYLDKGGQFRVTQSEVAPDHWEITSLHVEMKGRILFFKTIGEHEDESRSNFHRVPDNLTIAQAAADLSRQLQTTAHLARK